MKQTIYVPDDLKSRMDAVEVPSWSEIACNAFRRKLGELASQKKEQSMDTVIDRLRASKAEHESDSFASGKELGEDWATHNAEYAELKSLDTAQGTLPYGVVSHQYDTAPEDCVFEVLYPDENDREHENVMAFRDAIFGNEHADYENTNLEFWSGFVDGALTIWLQVEAKL